MEIKKVSSAGTVESSDVLVTVAPNTEGVKIEIESSVIKQYGRQIRETVEDVVNNLKIDNAIISLNDQGALDCTIRARVETAIIRATEYEGEIKWGEMIV